MSTDDADDAEDQELVRRAVMKDEAAITELLAKYHGRLLAVADKVLPADLRGAVDLDDILQDLFVILLKALKNYDPHKGKVRAWLLAVAANVARDIFRSLRGKAKPGADSDLLAALADPTADGVETEARRQELRDKVAWLLARLAPDDADLLRRCWMNGERQAVVAADLGRTPGAVAARLQRIKVECLDLLGRVNDYFTTLYPPPEAAGVGPA